MSRAPLPLWGIFILLPGLALSGWLMAYLGAGVMSTGNWFPGAPWAFGMALALGGTFFLSRLASLKLALIITPLFYMGVVIGSQIFFYEHERDHVYRTVAADASGRFPLQWKSLGREELYRQWMADVLDDPQARGWWDHLRATAAAGITHQERTLKGYGPVYRRGWQLWLNWSISYFLGALGAAFGLIGCMIWSGRQRNEARAQGDAQETVDQVCDGLRQYGVSSQTVSTVVFSSFQHRPLDKPIPLGDVAALLPELKPGVLRAIRDDLELNRQGCRGQRPEQLFDPDRLRLAEKVIQRFFRGREKLRNRPCSWLLIVIAAYRLHEVQPAERFWFSLQRIVWVYRALGYHDPVEYFSELDLSGMAFKRVPVGNHWASLASPRPTFFAPDSPWKELEQMPTEDIPEAAYLGILYQYYFRPDSRTYEMWWGIEPKEIVARLGPRLRNALLTFIETEAPRQHGHSRVTRFASIAATWPYEIAAPIMERALQAGWHDSLSDVPKSDEWYQLLKRYNHSPFDKLSPKIRWL